MPKRSPFAVAAATLRAHALAKPAATEHFPWGETAIKVNGKVFLFMHVADDSLGMSTKLADTSSVALLLPFAEPTGYGLGKAGWVSARFEGRDTPPVELLCAWIDESYQAVAPAKLAKLVTTDAATAPSAKKPAPKKPAPRKPAPKKPAPKKPAPGKPAPKKPAPRKPAPKKPARR